MSRALIPLAERHAKAKRIIGEFETQQEAIRGVLKKKGTMTSKLAEIEKIVYPLRAVEPESEE